MSQWRSGSPEEHFSRAMKELRTRRGWSQERLSEEVFAKTGVRLNPSSITRIEWLLDPGRIEKARAVRLNEAVAIAQTFGSDIGLMTSTDPGSSTDPQLAINELVAGLKRLAEEEAELVHALDVKRLRRQVMLQQVETIKDDFIRSTPADGLPSTETVNGPVGSHSDEAILHISIRDVVTRGTEAVASIRDTEAVADGEHSETA